jgi:hypothetical protein
MQTQLEAFGWNTCRLIHFAQKRSGAVVKFRSKDGAFPLKVFCSVLVPGADSRKLRFEEEEVEWCSR